jgi:hypothetical protein
MNGFTGIYEVDFQIIMNLWLQKRYTHFAETDNTLKVAIISMINLYNTCHYFQNLLDDPIYFQQFQVKIGYKMFERFADIDSVNELIKCLPITTKNDNKELAKLAAGNVVSRPFLSKNYRLIEVSDSHGRMIEIDAKGTIIGNKTISIFSKIVERRYTGHNEVFIVQHWCTSDGGCINTDHLCVKTGDRRSSYITSINDSFIRTAVPW